MTRLLLERAVELWSADLVTDDHALVLATLTILLTLPQNTNAPVKKTADEMIQKAAQLVGQRIIDNDHTEEGK